MRKKPLDVSDKDSTSSSETESESSSESDEEEEWVPHASTSRRSSSTERINDGGNTTMNRLLKGLAFQNPGKKTEMATATEANEERNQRPRRRNTKEKKDALKKKQQAASVDKRAIDICDCLSVECPGCHSLCEQCGSSKCSYECRLDRESAVLSTVIEGIDESEVYNPFLR
jgi:hypothetical protein